VAIAAGRHGPPLPSYARAIPQRDRPLFVQAPGGPVRIGSSRNRLTAAGREVIHIVSQPPPTTRRRGHGVAEDRTMFWRSERGIPWAREEIKGRAHLMSCFASPARCGLASGSSSSGASCSARARPRLVRCAAVALANWLCQGAKPIRRGTAREEREFVRGRTSRRSRSTESTCPRWPSRSRCRSVSPDAEAVTVILPAPVRLDDGIGTPLFAFRVHGGRGTTPCPCCRYPPR